MKCLGLFQNLKIYLTSHSSECNAIEYSKMSPEEINGITPGA